MNYRYHLLDPRDVLAGVAYLRDNEALGLEVTIPELATACRLGNIDPQHTGRDARRAAIEDVVTVALPPAGTVLITVRPDADAIGSMAVLEARAAGEPVDPARVGLIAEADKEAVGPWPGPGRIRVDEVTDVAVVNAVCMDHRTPLEDRVSAVRQWLTGGTIPGGEEIRARLRDEAAAALAATKVTENDGVAAVTSTHRKGVDIGYQHAPVVVATNPSFRWQGGPAHVKHTVARWNTSQPMDWAGMLAALRQAEPGWGGSSSICGSPQGVGSTLSQEQVVEIVRRYC